MENGKAAPPLKPIVLRELIAEKNSKLASRLPKFVYGLMNKLLHIREVNEIIRRYGHLQGIPFIEAVLDYFDVKVVHHGEENLPSSGQFIFASNHPLGGFDGLMLIKAVSDHMGKSLFLVRDELTKIPPLSGLFIPINKFGDQRRSASLINAAYDSENQILIFPSGLASRKIKGKIVDLTWQKHFIQKSVEHHRDIVPVFISGKNSRFFYCLANFRKWSGIRVNIEMFLLSDELFKNRGKTFVISFGKPVPWSSFDRTKTALEWAAVVKDIVYQLDNKPNK
jgi:putative hemolysin